MRVAFYAPMKPPDHPVPSGDRRVARAFFELLEHLGHEVELACRLRTRDPAGSRLRQTRLDRIGATAARLLLRRIARGSLARPDLWFTYHLYHKAPDPLGPRVADALGIPYVVAEASVAPRRARGAWARGFEQTARALARADAVLAVTRRDLEGLAGSLSADVTPELFPPFLDPTPYRQAAACRDRHRAHWAVRLGLDPSAVWLLAVAMMRDDVKLRSYRFLARSLAAMRTDSWQLVLAGDGAARAKVEAAFARFAPRVRLTGLVEPARLAGLYAAADLYVWPGFGEAYGMSYLEAQAAGLPVVAIAGGGVPDVVADGRSGLLVRRRDPRAYARAMASLLVDVERRRALADHAAEYVATSHDAAAAAARLAAVLAAARARRASLRGREATP